MWGIFFVIIGILGIFFINLFENVTSTNDQNYYLLKETTEAAMFDSIDLAQFRENGTLRIIKEKFVENFTRRFAQSTNIQRDYNIEFLEIIEEPPKVTIRIGSTTEVTFTEENMDMNIRNVLNAILETNWTGNEGNQPTLEGCHIDYKPPYTYKCKKTMNVCEPIYNCDGSWKTIKTYGYKYSLTCYQINQNNAFVFQSMTCGPCVKTREEVRDEGENCDELKNGPWFPWGTYSIVSCVLSSRRECDGTQIQVGEDCKMKTVYTTCYEPAKYEVVCD